MTFQRRYGSAPPCRVNSITQTIAGLTPAVTLGQQYDANGNRTQVSASFTAATTTSDFVNNYTYDVLNRTTQITQTGVNGGNAVSQKRVDLSYLRDGQLKSISRYANLTGTQFVAGSEYGYNNRGELGDLVHTTASASIASYAWTYDTANRVNSFTNAVHPEENVTYSYDPDDQLTHVHNTSDVSGASDEDYLYFANGNRDVVHNISPEELDYDVLPANRYERDGVYIYAYDGEGNLTFKMNYLGDFEVTTYSWDNRNRLTEVKQYGGGDPNNLAGHTLLSDVTYKYDAFNRLVYWQAVDSSENRTQSAFVYDGRQVALEFDKVGSGDIAASDLSNRYLWGPAVDQLLADEQVHSLASAANNDTLWTLTDNLGNIRDVVDSNDTERLHRAFDSFGNVTSETHYNASGNTVTSGAGYLDEAFGFTGRWFDKATGLQNNLNRWYDPKLGRWISEDPAGFAAGDANLYRYVGNEPTTWADPSGMWRWFGWFRDPEPDSQPAPAPSPQPGRSGRPGRSEEEDDAPLPAYGFPTNTGGSSQFGAPPGSTAAQNVGRAGRECGGLVRRTARDFGIAVACAGAGAFGGPAEEGMEGATAFEKAVAKGMAYERGQGAPDKMVEVFAKMGRPMTRVQIGDPMHKAKDLEGMGGLDDIIFDHSGGIWDSRNGEYIGKLWEFK